MTPDKKETPEGQREGKERGGGERGREGSVRPILTLEGKEKQAGAGTRAFSGRGVQR
jgi:hypothetical protein